MTNIGSLRCTRCNGDKFLVGTGKQLNDHDMLTCAKCGTRVQAGTARKQARDAVEKALADQIRRSFK